MLTTVRAGSDGVARATVNVPDWAERRDYVFVAAGPGDQKLISDEGDLYTLAGATGSSCRATG